MGYVFAGSFNVRVCNVIEKVAFCFFFVSTKNFFYGCFLFIFLKIDSTSTARSL